MMRLFRLFVTLLFAAVTLLFAWTWYKSAIRSDKTRPVITIDGELIEVALDATDEDLLAGVTAYDAKDGDLTDRVIVESISKFSELGVCKVYYAVCDNDNHVTSASRKIRYLDYTSPVFYMERSLCFSQQETVNVGSVIGAKDVLDGDISGNIIITSTDYEYGTVGKYTVLAEVANSKGDLISIRLPLYVEDRNINAPKIELSDYLIYVSPGTTVDPRRYFVSATDSFEHDVSESLLISNNYNKNEPGVYSFDYYADDSIGRRGHSILTVVVKENAEG